MITQRAFPTQYPGTDGSHTEEGMTLRDWFAGQALNECIRREGMTESAANEAYFMADAMLRAREAKP